MPQLLCGRRGLVVLVVFVVLGAIGMHTVPGIAGGRRPRVVKENLLSVITPVHKGTVNAHPWVNVRVRFGQASDGSPADPATFQARFGKCRLGAELFEDVVEDGAVVEKRIRLGDETVPRCRLKAGKRLRNRLRFKVAAVSSASKRKRLRDADKVRFAVAEAGNQSPVAQLHTAADLITPNVEIAFTAVGSHDPDGDWLTYQWDFGDGTTGSGESVTHTYATSVPVTVRLQAFDGGGSSGIAERLLPALPALDPGRTAGILRLSASSALDFGAVPTGGSATRTFTVHNDATDPISQVRFTVEALANGAFSTDCPPTAPACELGPGEQREVTVTLEPATDGHTEAVLQVLATASNRGHVQLLAHGFGGDGPAVPWGTADTVFYLNSLDEPQAISPDGTAVSLDAGTGTCQGGSLDGAPCVENADCPTATCGPRACVGGSSHGTPCSGVMDCPAGSCGAAFEPVDMCADGSAVYLLNDVAYFDPDLFRDPPQSGMILRVGLDGSREIVTNKVTEESLALGCARNTNGRIFWANYDYFGPDEDERENLKSISKNGGTIATELPNITQRLGDVDPDNYIEEDGYINYETSTALQVGTDGTTVYVANFNGLYRLLPTPLVLTFDVDELFGIFPDGSILAADVTDGSTASIIRLYKIDPNAARTGAIALKDLTPWATMAVPNNQGACETACSRATFVNTLAADTNGIVFVNVFTTGGGTAVPRTLRPRGTVRFEPVQGGASGVATGFVNLDFLDRLRF